MIHYHGTPCSSKVNTAKILAGKHALVSFAARDHEEEVIHVSQSYVLDNGAFSYYRKGGPPPSWEPYYRWVGTHLREPNFDWALIPDVIDGSEEENDALLDAWPHGRFYGVPVYHVHESLSRARRLAARWPRVALGSSGDFWKVGSRKWWERMGEIIGALSDSRGRPITKLHGLRMLNPEIFSKLPLASADSTNVGQNCNREAKRYGALDPVVGAAIIMSRVEASGAGRSWNDLPNEAKGWLGGADNQ